MGRKRKRPGRLVSDTAPVSLLSKRQKTHHPTASAHRPHSHPVLARYYPKVQTLREYMLSVLPDSSRSRRRKIASLRYESNDDVIELKSARDKDQGQSDESKLAHLLDSTLVGVGDVTGSESVCRSKDFELFSQQLSSTIASSLGGGTLSQPEVRASLFF
jgi:telomerase reverse transcriptase